MATADPVDEHTFGQLEVGQVFIPAHPGKDLNGNDLYDERGGPRVLVKSRQLNEDQRSFMRHGDTYNADLCHPTNQISFAIPPELPVIPH